ncbi:MAG TPA: DUF2000 domain-containing protein [Methylomusa anaerophila]|uniref:DUF2000 domain-containing protein n=1 Tax=Methylomusa anaerophila TaxID=1930071 RepID=A0A348AQI8_9FIRM|nr:DUF2000 domain-containing protein [Methylomusa anaerophila]BBB93336.1 hypothetical protein MAMMFC1_04048 [Methylomusa anaerophila]HML86833.1 DUF2000 domain-containing protein [Methylomusa anaerophila]
MRFDNKIVAILREDLLMWQKLNVTAFIMSGIGGRQDVLGEPYVDGTGNTYLPMSKQPIMIYAANGEQLKELLLKALNKEVNMAIYTEELFNTYNDADNRAKVAEFDTNNLNLVGIGMVGKKNHVDRLTKGLSLHE